MFHIVLIEPEIPQNTGNIARLCVAAGARLHLVGPLGFSIDEKAARRAGMDYWDRVDLKTWTVVFREGDFLVFGRETKGLPASLLAAYPESAVTIPMTEGTRSLNLATSAGIVLYEAIRQIAVCAGES